MDSKEPIDPQEPEIRELADEIYRDKVRRARGLTVGERVETGLELFEGSLGVMRSGIRHQFPEADAGEVESILRTRLKRLRQVHEQGTLPETGGNLSTRKHARGRIRSDETGHARS